ncbi:dynamin family protein [Streptomyces sp. NPDC019539]|uniref:dynamin family protein n=1 Tax=Streptomyces sp. NPDC019539 TaxID=3365063 RepID=UPI0037BA7552
MSQTQSTTLADAVQTAVKEAKENAGKAISGLAALARDLDMEETADRLRTTEEQLRADTFKLIVMGRFKNGKSTLLNAILGGTTRQVDLGGQYGPMVVDDLPATATLTGVRYAEEPYVKAWGFDGKAQSWSLRRYLTESVLDTDQEESERRFAGIKEFEMGFPAKLCRSGVTVYDSPGLDDHPTRTPITQEATRRCDAAIIVYRSDVLMGQGEMMDAARVVADGTRVFTVVNLWGRAPDERLKGFVWNRYVRDQLGGPKYDGQDLAAQSIYFLDAENARRGRYDGDEALVAASGLTAFEQQLGDYLRRERSQIHLRKFATQAGNLAAGIEQHIDQRRVAARTDQERLHTAYEAILPRLTALQDRPSRLPGIFDRHRRRAEAEMTASFLSLVARLRQELPGHMETVELPTGDKFTKVFQQRKLLAEAYGMAGEFVTERIRTWVEKESVLLLRPVLEDLATEIEKEVASIGRELDEIHLGLTGWQVASSGGGIVSTKERVLSTIGAVLVGDLASALGGGAGGWRGAVGAAAGGFSAGLLLALAGVTSAAVFLPVALVAAALASIAGGGAGLVNRAKKKVLADVDGKLALMPDEKTSMIAAELKEQFDTVERAVTIEITALLQEERRNIEEIVELNQRDQAERDRALASLDDAARALADHRLALQRALVTAQQG